MVGAVVSSGGSVCGGVAVTVAVSSAQLSGGDSLGALVAGPSWPSATMGGLAE
jgi:hypothetical protein